ncbi:MAG: shikimate dehydrogenase [Lachnospiraceae bacterium]|nr:shikimate dehydrogenase [Lachnospiraceae bacterium]
MQEIDGRTKLAGLLGDPVAHTKSPLIHNTLAQMRGDNLVYVPFHVKQEDLMQAVKGAHALGLIGLNVTVPHKSAVIPYLSGTDPLAKAIGAVNTLVYTNEGYWGYNTDILGLREAMRRAGFSIEGRRVLLTGAGGAARAVAFLCLFEKAAAITIANRSVDKAEALAQELQSFAKDHPDQVESIPAVAVSLEEAAKGAAGEDLLAIQCTSVGLAPKADACVFEENAPVFNSIKDAVDLIYEPQKTLFLERVEKRGGRILNGMDMLLFQGVIAYQLWQNEKDTQIHIPEEILGCIGEKLSKKQ